MFLDIMSVLPFHFKVSPRSCNWWDCLSWFDLDSRHLMAVGIWNTVMLVVICCDFSLHFIVIILNIHASNCFEVYLRCLVFLDLSLLVSGYWIPLTYLSQLKLFVCLLHLYSLPLLHGQLIFWQRFVHAGIAACIFLLLFMCLLICCSCFLL